MNKHPGDYWLGLSKNPKGGAMIKVRCLEKDRHLLKIFTKDDLTRYDSDGLLKPQYWSLPRTKNAESFVLLGTGEQND